VPDLDATAAPNMDDEVVPATLSAALALEPGGDTESQEVSVATVIEHLIATRSMNMRRATIIATTGKCDECRCLIGATTEHEACECPCHCQCCCPPLFHCVRSCVCDCACHYEASSDTESHNSDPGEKDASDTRSEASIALGQASTSASSASQSTAASAAHAS
jgi:hypothetical protein